MSSAYHMEALRKQRMIDRARQANTSTVDHEIPPAPVVETAQGTSTNSYQSDRESSLRPKSASSVAATPSTAIKIESESRTASRQTTRPASAASSKIPPFKSVSRPSSAKTVSTTKTESIKCSTGSQKSTHSSRPASACTKSSSQKSQSRLSSEKELLPSQNTSPTAAPSEITRSQSNSRATRTNDFQSQTETFYSGKKSSRSTSAASKQSWTSKAEMRADEVRRDLHKQEVVLRDSNLVMGEIPAEEEIQ